MLMPILILWGLIKLAGFLFSPVAPAAVIRGANPVQVASEAA